MAFALRALHEVIPKKRLHAEALLDHLRPALLVRSKGIVLSAVQLLQKGDWGNGALHARVALLAAEALAHPDAQVEKKALDVIQRYANPPGHDLKQVLGDRLPNLAPSQRSRLEAWLAKFQPERLVEHGSISEPELDDLLCRAAVLDPDLTASAGVPAAIERLQRHRHNPDVRFDWHGDASTQPGSAVEAGERVGRVDRSIRFGYRECRSSRRGGAGLRRRRPAL